MPRPYQRAVKLAKLSAQQEAKNGDDDSDDEIDFPEDPEGDNGNQQEYLVQTLDTAPHFTFAAANTGMLGQMLHDQDEDMAQDFPNCLVTMPLPVFVAQDGQTPRVEACVQRPQEYEDWNRQLNSYNVHYKKRTSAMKQREQKHRENVYDIALFEMAEHIARQENPFFRDVYDYYYTGGNINTIPFEDGGHLAMHVSGDKLRDLNFSEINSEAELWHPLHSAKMDNVSSEFFEIFPLQRLPTNSGHRFLARSLKEVSLYELKRAEDLELEDYKIICHSKFSSQEAPFTSASQSLGNANTLALACQDRSMRFVDMLTQQDIAKHNVRLLKGLQQTTSTWAQLLPADGNTFHYLSQPVLLTVDVRCDKPLNPCFASKIYSRACESFSCLAKGVNPNLLYVASNHKLHCLDMRCLGKKLADRSVVTWTHQMTYPPVFMDTFAHRESEYVALAGAFPSDMRICELKGSDAQCVDEMFSPAMPFSPPTQEEALIDARLRGFVDVYSDLPERIKTCRTGLRFHRLEAASDQAFAQLLSANSLGDVYCQRLTLRDEDDHVQEMRTGLHTAEAISYTAKIIQERVQRQSLRCCEVQRIPEIREIFREAAKRSKPDEKPVIVEEIEIDYGIEDTDLSEDESQNTEKTGKEPTKSESKGKKKHKKKSKEKPKQQPKKKNPGKVNIKKDKGINRGPWQKSAYKLSHYTDILSVRLLAIWNMEEFDNTRDVNREMFHERLQDKELEPEKRMADWLNQLPSQPENIQGDELTEGNPELVPGTKLPKLYAATTAEYLEMNGHIKEQPISPKKELPVTFRHQHSVLLPGQNTIIEGDLNPRPAKRPKIKHVMGF
ncbi:uncharacterized protein LOC119551411 [Drosophila subpulchrella]|uniref:uncharacterized protein LOC119551411 n=1 Tax=Drosophila subpulchrella TaxID=1486046 RepID=UPI0018A18184|nr:uncharacterized protein LOC119551411 [Drosophila subpulchrella]